MQPYLQDYVERHSVSWIVSVPGGFDGPPNVGSAVLLGAVLGALGAPRRNTGIYDYDPGIPFTHELSQSCFGSRTTLAPSAESAIFVGSRRCSLCRGQGLPDCTSRSRRVLGSTAVVALEVSWNSRALLRTPSVAPLHSGWSLLAASWSSPKARLGLWDSRSHMQTTCADRC